MGRIARHLNESISGNVFDSPKILKLYSKDNSPLTITPELVAFPESVSDLKKIVEYTNASIEEKKPTPITMRGSGQNDTGSALSEGIVISTAKLDKLLDIDKRERLVRVQPGITLKELNKILAVNGLHIPIYGHDQDTIGGLISTAPIDAYSGKYHGITRYVRQLEILLPSGDIIHTRRFSYRSLKRNNKNKNSAEKTFYRDIKKLITNHNDTVNKIARDHIGMAGYPNVTKVMKKRSMNLLPLFFGAEGTLGIITEITLNAIPIDDSKGRVVATFRELHTAKHFLDTISSLHPLRLEIYDNKFIHTAETTGKKSSGITNAFQKGFVVFAEFDKYRRTKLQKIKKLATKLPSTTRLTIESPSTKSSLDHFEQLINGFLLPTSNNNLPSLKNIYIPTWNLSSFINDLELIESALKLDIIIYGSYSTSIFHIIPKFDETVSPTPQKIKKLYEAIIFFIKREGGSIAGGTPEGRTKAPITNASLTSTERDLYLAIKHAFDPHDILNPSAKLGASPDFAIDKIST